MANFQMLVSKYIIIGSMFLDDSPTTPTEKINDVMFSNAKILLQLKMNINIIDQLNN